MIECVRWDRVSWYTRPAWILARVRHAGKPFTFVTAGVSEAVAKAQGIAGDRSVSICGPAVMRQCLQAGLLDEISVDLVPVVLGKGIPMHDRRQPTDLASIMHVVRAAGSAVSLCRSSAR